MLNVHVYALKIDMKQDVSKINLSIHRPMKQDVSR